MKTKEKTYLVFIDNSGFDSEPKCKRMTGAEIRKEFEHAQMGVAIAKGGLIKDYDSIIDLKRL